MTDENNEMADDRHYSNTSSRASLFNKFPSDYEETSAKRLGTEIVRNAVNHVFWTKGGEFSGSSMECSPVSPKLEIQQTDQRLNHWQTYLRNHARISEKLSKATGKPKSDLLINRNEDFRKNQQCKKLFDIAERLSPSKLINRQLATLKNIACAPMVFETLPKTERKTRSSLVFTEMPEIALEEQGLPLSKSRKSSWLQSEYLEQRCIQSKDKLERVVTHYPDMDKLQIVGTKMKKSTVKLEEGKLDIQTPENMEFSIKQAWYREKESTLEHVIYVNDQHFDADFKQKQNVNFAFIFECKPFEYQMKNLTIHNKGCKSVDIAWIRIGSRRPNWLAQLQMKAPIIPAFYFNKNPLSIQPGSVEKLEITFCCREYGIYEEHWEMKTVPSFFEQRFCLNISLLGHCRTDGMHNEKFFQIENSINKRSSRRVAENIVYDLAAHAIPDQAHSMPDLTSMHFSQSELFTLSNPNLNYNEDCVEQLKDMFVELVCNNHKKGCMEWNFDLKEMKNLILNIADEDKRSEFYKRFKIIAAEMKTCSLMVRPNYEDQKFLLVKNVLLELADSVEHTGETLREAIMHTPYDLSFDEVLVTYNQLSDNRSQEHNEPRRNVNNNYNVCVVKSEYVRNKKSEAFHESLYIHTNSLLCKSVEQIVGILEGMKNVE